MKNAEYQMTTVVKYVESLEKDLTEKEKKIKKAAERYILGMNNKAEKNAKILEMLLA